MLTKSEGKVGIIDQPTSCIGGDTEFLRIYLNIDGRPKKGRVSEERVKRAGDENEDFLELRPLQWIIGIFGGDGEERLAIGGVVAI